MKTYQIVPLLLTSLIALSVSAGTTKPAATAPAVNNSVNVYTEDKTSISVSAAQPQFTLKLKSNPTTGYSWFLREYDTNLIAPVKHSFVAGESGLIGAPGFEYWVFKVKPAAFVVPHETTIRMFYARPWETTDSGTMAVFRIMTR